jgi:hypothetical protein
MERSIEFAAPERLMHQFVAVGAKCEQVLFHVATRMAAESEVVYLKLLHAAADLASPAIALQHLSMEFSVAR